MNKFLNFLHSNKAVLIAAIASLMTQLWHSVRAFVHLDVGGESNPWNYLFGILFAASTSFAILLFTVRGRKWLAFFFLLVEVFVNVIHYGVIGGMDGGAILYSTIFMCIIVPVTIAVYSNEIKPEPEISISSQWESVDPMRPDTVNPEDIRKYPITPKDAYRGPFMDPFDPPKPKPKDERDLPLFRDL